MHGMPSHAGQVTLSVQSPTGEPKTKEKESAIRDQPFTFPLDKLYVSDNGWKLGYEQKSFTPNKVDLTYLSNKAKQPITLPMGRCLDVKHGQIKQNQLVQVWRCNNTSAQQWFKDDATGHICINQGESVFKLESDFRLHTAKEVKPPKEPTTWLPLIAIGTLVFAAAVMGHKSRD